jgi:hypothetical protein
MSLDLWVRTYRDAWKHEPRAAAALGMQLLDSPSPFSRVAVRELAATLGAGDEVVLVGPRRLNPLRELEPLKGYIMILDELNYRFDQDDDSDGWDSRISVRFGNEERRHPSLPDFKLSFYRPHVFGALKPRLVAPRDQDVRASALKVGNDGTLDFSLTVRFEPVALMEAAGLVDPEIAAREGTL